MQVRGPSRKQRVPPLNKCTRMPEIIPGTSPRAYVKTDAQSAAVGKTNSDEHTALTTYLSSITQFIMIVQLLKWDAKRVKSQQLMMCFKLTLLLCVAPNTV